MEHAQAYNPLNDLSNFNSQIEIIEHIKNEIFSKKFLTKDLKQPFFTSLLKFTKDRKDLFRNTNDFAVFGVDLYKILSPLDKNAGSVALSTICKNFNNEELLEFLNLLPEQDNIRDSFLVRLSKIMSDKSEINHLIKSLSNDDIKKFVFNEPLSPGFNRPDNHEVLFKEFLSLLEERDDFFSVEELDKFFNEYVTEKKLINPQDAILIFNRIINSDAKNIQTVKNLFEIFKKNFSEEDSKEIFVNYEKLAKKFQLSGLSDDDIFSFCERTKVPNLFIKICYHLCDSKERLVEILSLPTLEMDMAEPILNETIKLFSNAKEVYNFIDSYPNFPNELVSKILTCAIEKNYEDSFQINELFNKFSNRLNETDKKYILGTYVYKNKIYFSNIESLENYIKDLPGLSDDIIAASVVEILLKNRPTDNSDEDISDEVFAYYEDSSDEDIGDEHAINNLDDLKILKEKFNLSRDQIIDIITFRSKQLLANNAALTQFIKDYSPSIKEMSDMTFNGSNNFPHIISDFINAECSSDVKLSNDEISKRSKQIQKIAINLGHSLKKVENNETILAEFITKISSNPNGNIKDVIKNVIIEWMEDVSTQDNIDIIKCIDLLIKNETFTRVGAAYILHKMAKHDGDLPSDPDNWDKFIKFIEIFNEGNDSDMGVMIAEFFKKIDANIDRLEDSAIEKIVSACKTLSNDNKVEILTGLIKNQPQLGLEEIQKIISVFGLDDNNKAKLIESIINSDRRADLKVFPIFLELIKNNQSRYTSDIVRSRYLLTGDEEEKKELVKIYHSSFLDEFQKFLTEDTVMTVKKYELDQSSIIITEQLKEDILNAFVKKFKDEGLIEDKDILFASKLTRVNYSKASELIKSKIEGDGKDHILIANIANTMTESMLKIEDVVNKPEVENYLSKFNINPNELKRIINDGISKPSDDVLLNKFWESILPNNEKNKIFFSREKDSHFEGAKFIEALIPCMASILDEYVKYSQDNNIKGFNKIIDGVMAMENCGRGKVDMFLLAFFIPKIEKPLIHDADEIIDSSYRHLMTIYIKLSQSGNSDIVHRGTTALNNTILTNSIISPSVIEKWIDRSICFDKNDRGEKKIKPRFFGPIALDFLAKEGVIKSSIDEYDQVYFDDPEQNLAQFCFHYIYSIPPSPNSKESYEKTLNIIENARKVQDNCKEIIFNYISSLINKDIRSFDEHEDTTLDVLMVDEKKLKELKKLCYEFSLGGVDVQLSNKKLIININKLTGDIFNNISYDMYENLQKLSLPIEMDIDNEPDELTEFALPSKRPPAPETTQKDVELKLKKGSEEIMDSEYKKESEEIIKMDIDNKPKSSIIPLKSFTRGCGNCFFHAIYGELENGAYICQNHMEKRQELINLIVDNKENILGDDTLRMALRGIIMESLTDDERESFELSSLTNIREATDIMNFVDASERDVAEQLIKIAREGMDERDKHLEDHIILSAILNEDKYFSLREGSLDKTAKNMLNARLEQENNQKESEIKLIDQYFVHAMDYFGKNGEWMTANFIEIMNKLTGVNIKLIRSNEEIKQLEKDIVYIKADGTHFERIDKIELLPLKDDQSINSVSP